MRPHRIKPRHEPILFHCISRAVGGLLTSGPGPPVFWVGGRLGVAVG